MGHEPRNPPRGRSEIAADLDYGAGGFDEEPALDFEEDADLDEELGPIGDPHAPEDEED